MDEGQTNRVVIHLGDSAVDREALAQQFRDWPIPGLEDIIVIGRDLTVGGL